MPMVIGDLVSGVDVTVTRSEQLMTDPAPSCGSTTPPAAPAAPTITVRNGYIITGAGFLPHHEVTLRVTDTAEDISDYLTYTTDARGDLFAELPTRPANSALHVTATDHRTDPDGSRQQLWSNTQTVCTRNA
jgi:hypothetical protein